MAEQVTGTYELPDQKVSNYVAVELCGMSSSLNSQQAALLSKTASENVAPSSRTTLTKR